MKRPTCKEWVESETPSSLLCSLRGAALFLQPQLEEHSHQSKAIQEEGEILEEVLHILFFFFGNELYFTNPLIYLALPRKCVYHPM